MQFYDLSKRKKVTVPESKVTYKTMVVNTKSNLGKRKITMARSGKLHKIVRNEAVGGRKSPCKSGKRKIKGRCRKSPCKSGKVRKRGSGRCVKRSK